jgi:hypothetical protein
MPWRGRGCGCGRAEGGDGEGALAGLEGLGRGSVQRRVPVRVAAAVVRVLLGRMACRVMCLPVEVPGNEEAFVCQRRREHRASGVVFAADAVGAQTRLREAGSDWRVCWEGLASDRRLDRDRDRL